MTKLVCILNTIALCLVLNIYGEIQSDHSNIEVIRPTDLLGQLSHKYKNTYVVYGEGRQKERDLPVCEGVEACNLAHKRYWLTPITERLCRCPKEACQMNYTSLHDVNSQHVSNRGQFKFCEPIQDLLNNCEDEEVGLEVNEIDRSHPQQSDRIYHDMRSNLLCKCPWPNSWTFNRTYSLQQSHNITYYTCNTLKRCNTGDVCGHTRADTLETYYTCSCPERHLCLFPWEEKTIFTNELYYRGFTHTGRCTLVYPEPDYY